MKEKYYSFSTSAIIVIMPWLLFVLAGGLYGKYKDNIQYPFDFSIKYGLICAIALLGISLISYILSLHNEKFKIWIGTTFKMSLITFMFVLVVWYLRPEYSSVMNRF